MCRHRNRKNNYMQLSRFICLSCLHTDTVAINGIQRGSSQREYGHIKDSVCIKCGDVKTMEVRENDYLISFHILSQNNLKAFYIYLVRSSMYPLNNLFHYPILLTHDSKTF